MQKITDLFMDNTKVFLDRADKNYGGCIMAKDSIMFNFADGARDVKVGDRIFEIDSLRSGRTDITPFTIIKIGNKLVTVQQSFYGVPSGREWQFYAETGRKKSNYSTYRTYSSVEAYEEVKTQNLTIERARNYTNGVITYKQAVEILKILGAEV